MVLVARAISVAHMKATEFEEKEYEAALYSLLERGQPHLWAPGQVLESYLGLRVLHSQSSPGICKG